MLSRRDIDPNALRVIKELQKAGHTTYLVGGAVRDLLLNIKPKDFDISTTATPEQVKKVFGRGARIIGRRFQIVHVHKGRNVFEVATFRRTPTEDERKSRENDDGQMVWSDNVWGSPEEDALRRDFTANALFLDPYDLDKGIIDFCGGLEDIENGVVRSLGDPETRFIEDPVRMLRALKLVGQYGFSLQEDIKDAIANLADKITLSSQRRLYEEILKITYKAYGSKTWEACHRYGLLKHLLPNFDELLGSEDGPLMLDFLQNRDNRIARGQSMSRAYSIACLCYRYVEKQLNPDSEFGDGWEFFPGIERKCRQAIDEFLAPHSPTRLISARVRDVLLLHERMTRYKAGSTKIIKHPEYHYGILLYGTLAETLDWSEEKRNLWKSTPRPKRTRDGDKGERQSSARRRNKPYHKRKPKNDKPKDA